MDTPSRSRGSSRPSFASSRRPYRDKGAGKAGRRWHPRSVREKMHTGWTTGVPVARPSLRDGLRRTSRSPRGALHYCPRRLADDRCADRSATASPQALTPEPRASGPHDLTVRARPRWESEGWRVLAPEAMRRRCQRRVVCARRRLLTVFRPAMPLAPTPSRPSLPSPRFVTIAIRPLSRARVFCLYDKSEFR